MKGIQRKWLRVFIAKYILYLEICAYAFVLTVGAGVFMAWWVEVDETVTSKPGPLTMLEHAVKATSDSVVVDLLVDDMVDVTTGQPVLAICDDPLWVNRQRARRAVETALLTNNPTSDSLASQQAWREMLAHTAAWDTPPPRVTPVAAPSPGMVWLAGIQPGAFVAADGKLFGVKDPDILVADLRCEGGVAKCRAGLKARVKILPVQNFETLTRLNVRRGWFANYQHDLSTVATAQLRAELERYLVKRVLQAKDEVPIPPTAVAGINLTITARPVLTDTATTISRPESFRTRAYDAVVATGRHNSSNTKLTELPADEMRRIRDIVAADLKSRAIDGEFGRYRVEQIDQLIANVYLPSEWVEPDVDLAANPTGLYPDQLPPPPKADIDQYVFYGFRRFFFSARLVNPDPELKAFVKQLTRQGQALNVTAELITDRRRFAMLLFRGGAKSGGGGGTGGE